MKAIENYLLNILKWLDIGVNVIFLLGASNETISERTAKARLAGKKWGCVFCAFLGWCATLFAGKPTDHCADALTSTIGGDAIIPDGE